MFDPILKAIGFSAPHLIMMLMGEAGLMGLIGGALGAAMLVALGATNAAGLSMPYFPVIATSPAVTAFGAALGVLISLASAAPPARRVIRLSVSMTLRSCG